MKKFLSLFMSIGLVFSLVGCGSSDKRLTHKDKIEVLDIMKENGYELKDSFYDGTIVCAFINKDNGKAFAMDEAVEKEYPNTLFFQYNYENIIAIGGDVINGDRTYDEVYKEYEVVLKKLGLLEADIIDTLQYALTIY